MQLTTGMPAPQFETEDVFGNPIRLDAYQGKMLLLSFYRYGACALCNLQVHKLIEKYPDYHRLGLEMLAVFESPRESVLQYVSKQDAPFPIIADPGAVLYDLYGLESSEAKVMGNIGNEKQARLVREAEAIGYTLTREEGANFFRLPADFLISPDSTVGLAFYSQRVGDHMSFEDIEQALKTMTQAGEAGH